MNTILFIIIGIIVISWLIALFHEEFRDYCIEDIPGIYSAFYIMYKEDDTGGVFYKVSSIILSYRNCVNSV